MLVRRRPSTEPLRATGADRRDGRALIVLNDTGAERRFNVTDAAGSCYAALPAGAATNFVWSAQ